MTTINLPTTACSFNLHFDGSRARWCCTMRVFKTESVYHAVASTPDAAVAKVLSDFAKGKTIGQKYSDRKANLPVRPVGVPDLNLDELDLDL